MKKVFFVLSMLMVSLAWAQKKSNPQTFANSITEDDLKKHLYTLAGSTMEGRETATEGQRKAATYIEEHFKTLGLQPGNVGNFQLPFPVYRDSLLSTQLVTNDIVWKLNQDFQPITQLSPSSSLNYFSQIVMVGHGIVDSAFDDYANVDVAGKAVLILDGFPQGYKTTKPGFQSPAGVFGKIRSAAKKGAAAVIIVGQSFPRRPMSALGNMYVNLYKETQFPNSYVVSEKVAEAITGTDWASIKEKSKKEKIPSKVYEVNTMLDFQKKTLFLQSTNVLGYMEGKDLKDQLLVISAHYDHLGKRDTVIYYGADDDGSGTVGVLEIAEAFVKAKAAGNGPRRSILFMTVSGEEKGLWGSEYYSNHPVYPLDKTTADLNIDMIGRVDTERKSADTLNYVYVVGDDKLSTDLKVISEATNKKYTKLTLDYKFNDPKDPEQIYYRSDHYNFARKGVPIIFYYDGMLLADYHKPTDTPDKINYALLRKRAQLVFYTAWEMANRNDMLKRDLELPKPRR